MFVGQIAHTNEECFLLTLWLTSPNVKQVGSETWVQMCVIFFEIF